MRVRIECVYLDGFQFCFWKHAIAYGVDHVVWVGGRRSDLCDGGRR